MSTKTILKHLLLLPIALCEVCICFCQDLPAADQTTWHSVQQINDNAFQKLNNEYTGLSATLNKQSLRLLDKLEAKERKLYAQAAVTDSARAKQLFEGSKQRYEALRAKLTGQQPVQLKQYLPGLDSMQTSFQFLNQFKSGGQLQQATASLGRLQSNVQYANEIQDFIKERQQQLSTLVDTRLKAQLTAFNKDAYYYGQSLSRYKAALQDPQKQEAMLLSVLRKLPAFQQYMQRNSYFAQLFPAGNGNANAAVAVTGLQTRGQLSGFLQQRAGLPAGQADAVPDPQQYIQPQLPDAQSQLNNLNNKLSGLGGKDAGTATMPDFKPNSQHTKSLFKRLEYGINIQSQHSSGLLPSLSDIGITVGYKVSDGLVTGVGASYKLGWGNGFRHIQLTNEGVGLRSFIDLRAKGSFWLSAGFEENYTQAFKNLDDLHYQVNAWQKSALAGVMKKIRVGKKEGNMQLLYDFLAMMQKPSAQPLKFRIGYTF